MVGELGCYLNKDFPIVISGKRRNELSLKMMSYPHRSLAHISWTAIWWELHKVIQMPVRGRTLWSERFFVIMEFCQLWGLQNWKITHYLSPFTQVDGNKNTQSKYILLVSNLGTLRRVNVYPSHDTLFITSAKDDWSLFKVRTSQGTARCGVLLFLFPFLFSVDSWKIICISVVR